MFSDVGWVPALSLWGLGILVGFSWGLFVGQIIEYRRRRRTGPPTVRVQPR